MHPPATAVLPRLYVARAVCVARPAHCVRHGMCRPISEAAHRAAGMIGQPQERPQQRATRKNRMQESSDHGITPQKVISLLIARTTPELLQSGPNLSWSKCKDRVNKDEIINNLQDDTLDADLLDAYFETFACCSHASPAFLFLRESRQSTTLSALPYSPSGGAWGNI